MAIERERKFLIPKLGQLSAFGHIQQSVYIEQGYLLINDQYHIRIRIITDIESGEVKAILGVKIHLQPGVKDEYEQEINISGGGLLYNTCSNRLIKRRLIFNKNIIIDVYPDTDIIAEIEYNDDGQFNYIFEKYKDIVGEEVTFKEEYSNISKAISGLNQNFQ